ncbi:hypothetical protein [Curtobacterium sp. ISL-83]|uniref:hypothetical protein n=1 Tax=Curtobacterium sp. ISL-83 TaxID=2819145 RepID=UPI001BE725BB|nr:hypothetical protein [Curtobacterium sp. ISL-83]MBT2502760.1 hypothetical protein [Curtobacterium sp. ISL-83]
MFRRRVLPSLVLTAVTVLAVSGCGAQDPTGQITVAVSANAANGPYEVQVFAASTGKLSEHQRVYPGGSARFAGVPIGRVTVRAAKLCPQKATVTNETVTEVTLTTTGC